MDPAAEKQQIVERIKQASNVLVTVSNNPSVDQLAACIGLTLLLNKIGKHATAVFSGQVPSTIEFLQPGKTIERNTDSLQDFIISLDKNKADKLRYKVEDQVVKIFITPYKTSLNEKDLIFSQGDFNVEVVMALGVKDKSQLDAAITAHGRILHDATVISVNVGNDKSAELGQINWHDPAASSLCEMLVSISEAFGAGLIDNQMATAFLTGIVAETARFSNAKTSPKVMTMSAQLMAAGANQQLIVSKLEPPRPPSVHDDKPVAKKIPAAPPKPPAPTGVLSVPHIPQMASSEEVEVKPDEIRIDARGNIISSSNEAPLKPSGPQSPMIRTAQMPLSEPEAPAASVQNDNNTIPGPHSLLNSTNHQPALDTPFTATTAPEWANGSEETFTDPLSDKPRTHDLLAGLGKSIEPTNGEALETVDTARSAVQNALAGAPFDPVHQKPPPPVPPPLLPSPGLGDPNPNQNNE